MPVVPVINSTVIATPSARIETTQVQAPPAASKRVETTQVQAPPAASKRVETAQNQTPPATSKRVETAQDNPPAHPKQVAETQAPRRETIQGAPKMKEPRVNPWIGRVGGGNNQVWPTNTGTPSSGQAEAEQTKPPHTQLTTQLQRPTHMTRGTRVSENQDDAPAKETIKHHEQFNAMAKAKQVQWHGELAIDMDDKGVADASAQHPQVATVSNTTAIKSASTAVSQSSEAKTGDISRESTPVMVFFAQLAHLILPVHFDSCASHNFIGSHDLWAKLQQAGIAPANCPAFGVAQGSSLPPVTQYMILPFTCIDDSGKLQHDKQALFYFCPVGATVLISKRQANQANILRYQPPPQYLATLIQHRSENQQPTSLYTTVLVDFAVQVDTSTTNGSTDTNTYIQVDVQSSVQDMSNEGPVAEDENTIDITSHISSQDGTCMFKAAAEGMKHFVDLHQKALQGRREKGELADILKRATSQQLRCAACDLIYKYQNEQIPNLGGRTPREYITTKYIEKKKPLRSVNGPYTSSTGPHEISEEPFIHVTSVHDYLIAMRKASTKGDTLCVVMLVEYVGVRIIILKQRIGNKHLSVQADMRPTDLQKLIHCSGNEALHLAGSEIYTATKHLMLLRGDKYFQWAHLCAEDCCKHIDCAPLHRALRVSHTVLTNAFRYGIPEKGEEDETEDTFRKDMMGRCLLSLGPPEDIDQRSELVPVDANQRNSAISGAAKNDLGTNTDHAPAELQGPILQAKPP